MANSSKRCTGGEGALSSFDVNKHLVTFTINTEFCKPVNAKLYVDYVGVGGGADYGLGVKIELFFLTNSTF